MEANKLHPLLGAGIPTLSRSSLPSKLQVMNVICFKMDSKHILNKEKLGIYHEVAKELISIWREAYITCYDEDYVIKIIQAKIVPLLSDVQKNNERYAKEEFKNAKLSELKEIVDIARCPCFRDNWGNPKPRAEFIYTNCVCPEKDKISNFPTYYDQVFDRSSVILISEDDKKNFETILADPDFEPAIRRKKRDEICPICEYHAPDIQRIHVHIDSKHPEHDEKTFVCNHCPRSFIFEASLKKHLINQKTVAKNRAKKISLGLMQRNVKKKYKDHYPIKPDSPTNDIQTKTIETGTYNIIDRPNGSCILFK